MTAEDWKRKSVFEQNQYHRCFVCVEETNLEVLCNFTYETLEGELANEQLR